MGRAGYVAASREHAVKVDALVSEQHVDDFFVACKYKSTTN